VEQPVEQKPKANGLSVYSRPEPAFTQPEVTTAQKEQPKATETAAQNVEPSVKKPATTTSQIDEGDELPEKPKGTSFGRWIRSRIENLGNTFVGDSQETEY
jgi:hypothetical protein